MSSYYLPHTILYINSASLFVYDGGPARAGWARERFKFIHNKFRHPVNGWCAGGCWITLAQCDLMEIGVQASSGWMVRRRVLNHSGPVWSDGNRCLASWNGPFRHVGKESTFPSYLIRHERMLSHHCGALLWMNEWMKDAFQLSYQVCTTHLAAAF